MGQHPSIATEEGGGSCKITELPLELLAEVLKDVDWRDILRIRQTCKRLNDASRAKAIWVDVYRRSISTSLDESLEPPRLDRPIEMYTSAELELTLLRWASAQLGWTAPGESPVRERVISTPPSYQMHLVEGGRWLLAVDCFSASISYYDLEASIVTGRILTPPMFTESEILASAVLDILLDIEMDYSSPTLAFNLAFTIIKDSYEGDHIAPRSPLDFKICIWHVELQLDQENTGVALAAQSVASFLHRLDTNYQLALHLRGCYLFLTVTFCWDHYDGENCIEIIDWVLANGQGFNYSVHIIPQAKHARCLRLLPGNKLLVISNLLIRLYDVTTAPELPATMSVSAFSFYEAEYECLPLWKVNTPGMVAGFMASKAFISSHMTCISFPVPLSNEVFGILINNDNSGANPPIISKLVDIPVNYNTYDGHYITCQYCLAVRLNHGNLVLMHYSWSKAQENHQLMPVTKIYSTESVYGVPPLVDSSSGRVVIPGPDRSNKIILDFALLSSEHST